jgi:hypothetical protein
MAFVNNVAINDQFEDFCPPLSRFQLFQQLYEQYRTLTAASNVADFTHSAVQCSG